MKSRDGMLGCMLLSLTAGATAIAATAANSARETRPEVLASIQAAAMRSTWAWTQLENLTDGIGPRLSGSPQLEAAVTQVANAMRALGARVTLQPAKVDHWLRGATSAELVSYPGQPAGVTQRLVLTALGTSAATPAGGLEAKVVVVRDLDELHARSAEVRGAIVVFDFPFDQRLADTGHAEVAYGRGSQIRTGGPAAAAALGAVAALVRSVGGADYRLPHTGVTRWGAQAPIPAAALAAEDAELIARRAARGPVRMRLRLEAQTLPDADSFNVIADWPGSELPNEYVIVSGHLDSWDLATGATDDGVGAMAAAGVIEVLQELKLHARRTIRFIAWTDEEFGGRGGQAYFDALGSAVGAHCAAIESDAGAGRALGVHAVVAKESLPALRAAVDALSPIGATALLRGDREAGTDIGPLQRAGVPGFAPIVDGRHYFDYHHTAADTLDKVDPQNLQSQVATMGVLAYLLADRTDCLPRYPTAE
jgi:carboxypeptidase Q